MFGYYLELSFHSVKRSPGLTALMVLSIGVGVALAMSSWTLVFLMSRDPIPQKSSELFFPTVDMWGRAADKQFSSNEPPDLLDYGSVEALLRQHRAKYQSANYWITPTVIPNAAGQYPFNVSGFAVTGQFFPMLDVPFKYGSGWSDADDSAHAKVVVIAQDLNERMFGGRDSVGKMLNIGGRDYRVVGVMQHWNPQPLYYDIPAFGGFMTQPIDVFLPFDTAIAAQIPVNGSFECFQKPEQPGFLGLLQSSCGWISYMVQIDSQAGVQRYHDYLKGFAQQRFNWPPNVRLRGLMAWLNFMQVLPPGVQILRLVGIGLLVVCMVDTIGLMLAKFLRRSGEIGIRRALGATKHSIGAQFLTESAVIGVAGGILGIVFTWLAMLWLRTELPRTLEAMTQVNTDLLGLTILVAIIATLLAALYPIWRAARVQPAIQIKTN